MNLLFLTIDTCWKKCRVWRPIIDLVTEEQQMIDNKIEIRWSKLIQGEGRHLFPPHFFPVSLSGWSDADLLRKQTSWET